MPVRKPQTKSRFALIVALTALAAAAALALATRPPGRLAEASHAAAPMAAAEADGPAAAASGRPVAASATSTSSRPASAGAGMRAYIDPVTGQLREPEQEELAAPVADGGVAASPLADTAEAPELDIPLADGGVARPVGDDTLVYTVATLGKDGRVTIEHAQGGAAARSKLAAGGKRPGAAAAEVRDDR